MTLTKADLVERLFNVVGINKREAKEVVDVLFDEIILALERGESVKLSGFGVFDWRDKKERPGRNPKTGEPVAISPRRVVTFRVGEKLKSKVEDYAGSSGPEQVEDREK